LVIKRVGVAVVAAEAADASAHDPVGGPPAGVEAAGVAGGGEYGGGVRGVQDGDRDVDGSQQDGRVVQPAEQSVLAGADARVSRRV
jgi:hypothetical protein